MDIIEAGFPITSPGDFEAVQAIAREVHGPVICGLARTGKQDIDAAWNAVKDSERPRIHTFIATSDIHIERKLQTTREDVKGQARAAVAHARQYTRRRGVLAEDGSRSDIEFMAEVIQIALDEGATTINVPDTVGYTMPDEYAEMWRRLYELIPGLAKVTTSVHCHNDLGLAVANSFAGVTGRRAPGRVRRERHRRAGRQRLARGDRDAAAHARVERGRVDAASTRARSRARRGWCRA